MINLEHGTIHVGDCREVLKTLPDKSVHACVTSPPYFGLRDYDVDDQIGQEGSLAEYVETLVEVFREVWRVLRDDGTLWLNLGDSYDKNKSRLLVPAQVALAMHRDGWTVRDEVIWSKTAVMPIPVKDRTIPSHEFIHLFTKQRRYYYDQASIREPAKPESAARYERGFGGKRMSELEAIGSKRPGLIGHRDFDGMRIPRSVWTVTPDRTRGAHIAMFPQKLIEPCILASTPEGGVVLDPFFGNGTTGVVAGRLGRRFIGVELNPTYANSAAERLGVGCDRSAIIRRLLDLAVSL